MVPAACLAGGVEPKAGPEAYHAHVKLPTLSIGAEYLVHSFSGQGRMYVTPDYLVIEAGVFPEKRSEFQVNTGNFSLRVNGKKTVLLPQTPGMVAASLKYRDWQDRSNIALGAGVGDAGVMVGGPPLPSERFPGDRREGRTRLPAPPRAPDPDSPTGQSQPETAPAHEVVVETALPEGAFHTPVAGYLYFAYKGKIKSIRSVELLYNGPAGAASLRLR